MKLTKQHLKQIIAEEAAFLLNEDNNDPTIDTTERGDPYGAAMQRIDRTEYDVRRNAAQKRRPQVDAEREREISQGLRRLQQEREGGFDPSAESEVAGIPGRTFEEGRLNQIIQEEYENMLAELEEENNEGESPVQNVGTDEVSGDWGMKVTARPARREKTEKALPGVDQKALDDANRWREKQQELDENWPLDKVSLGPAVAKTTQGLENIYRRVEDPEAHAALNLQHGQRAKMNAEQRTIRLNRPAEYEETAPMHKGVEARYAAPD